MNKKIEDKTGTYIEIPRAKIKFASKEAETIFDLSLENDWLEQEKQTLKKQLEGVREERDYLFNKLSLQNKYLAEENQELKKQLEEAKNLLKEVLAQVQDTDDAFSKERGFMHFKINGYKTQQKSFIKFLEDEIKSCEAVSDSLFNSNKEMKAYKSILQKYKEIIGLV